MKTVVINGRVFEVVKVDRVPFYYGEVKNLANCYKKPSKAKQEIWRDWSEFAFCGNSNNSVMNFGILSFNCNFITIGWNEEINGEEVAFRITPTHNYIIIE